MSRGFLLDTEMCVAILRRKPEDVGVLERMQQVPVAEIAISAVTLSELQYGAQTSRRTAQEQAALEVFLRHVAVVDYPQDAAEHYAMLRMVLELGNVDLSASELLVAAHARCAGRTLISARAGEIGRVTGVMVEDWAKGSSG